MKKLWDEWTQVTPAGGDDGMEGGMKSMYKDADKELLDLRWFKIFIAIAACVLVRESMQWKRNWHSGPQQMSVDVNGHALYFWAQLP